MGRGRCPKRQCQFILHVDLLKGTNGMCRILPSFGPLATSVGNSLLTPVHGRGILSKRNGWKSVPGDRYEFFIRAGAS